ncbi:LamG domain-containing protein [Akkermansiaceae bacterium]|nr:LamG domain-containing protein [Akkermansiaceae bacterium]
MRYPGDSHYWFGHEEEFSRRLQMTVEAWVYREDSTWTESVLSHGSISEGFFFGFASEKIRFGRSGGFAVLSEGDVPSGQWAHVAVSYDGSMARFYINGEGAGVLSLQHAGFSQTGPLRLVGGPGGGVLGFKGSLDEIRLWSEVRSAAELNSRRFVELDASSNEEDLELVFPIGSRIEVVMEDGPWADQVGSGLSLEYTGVLPRELVIPQASNHPKFDGNVDPRTEYAGAEELVMRYEDGPSFRDANAYLAHDGEFLYVGLEGVRLPAGGSPLSNNFLTIFLDPDGSSPRFDGELKRIRYRLNDGSATFSRLETEPFARWVEDPQLSVDFQALRGTERQGEFTSARDVEFRIRRSVMGDFHLDGFDRLAIVHENHGGPGGTSRAPEVPFPGSYRLAAHDTWARPANNPTQPGSWRYAANRVAVVPPPYEDLHGFPFINIADGHDLTTYRAAFPDHVCNPLYMVGAWAYAPIYLSMAEGGQCVGMVVSANRLARGRSNLRPGSPLHTVHDDVLFGNGFRNADGFMGDGSWVPFPVRPSRYDVSNPCAPEPTNIWGRIKADHAVQFSSEYIGKLLEQFDLGEHGLVINHADVLEKIRFNPLRYQLCVRDGGKGHCVQPLRVIDTVIEEGVVQPHRHNIEVWDPNWPNRTRVIEVTIEPGQPGEYFYDAFGGGPWQGNWMFVYEIDPLWEGERHIPSIDTLAAALAQFGVTSIGQLLQLVISGDAEAMVSVPGHSAGWDGSGNFSETGEATLVIPPFNWLRTEEPPLGHLPANMIHRLEFGAPEVTVHNRGESYTFHSSHEGTMFQYFVNGAEDGTSDELAYLMEGELVTGVDFEAGGAGRSVNARVALCEDGGSYPAAMTFENLPVLLGTSQ